MAGGSADIEAWRRDLSMDTSRMERRIWAPEAEALPKAIDRSNQRLGTTLVDLDA